MKVTVEITSKQIFEDHTETEKNKSVGEITYKDKGTILEFTEKYEEQNQELHFKMTILENKIITNRNNQTMIFDEKNKNNTILDTPLGTIGMEITTTRNKNNKRKRQNKKYISRIQNRARK